jgi:predicted lipid-binding transport protein (Tim44 family)
MKQPTVLLVTLLAGVLLAVGSIDDAQAKRFGGGKSFGGRSAYSSPYRRSLTPKRSLSQQQASAKNQRLRDQFSRRGGLMGMLGGLALGGLLGSLLFGGAFEGLNLLDLLVFGLVAFVLYKIFAGRKQPGATASTGGGYRSQDADFADEGYHRTGDEDFDSGPARRQRAGFDTDLLFDKDARHDRPSDAVSDGQPITTMPAEFDERAFLAGARSAYERLQAAWDRADLAQIRSLTTDKVFAEIQQQLCEREADNQTEILKLDAELLEMRESGSEWEATVLFDTILREEPQQRPHQVREIWHFTRPARSVQPTWFLDGIQQLES